MNQFDVSTGPSLFVVATPIGNMGDLTPRARSVLSQVDRIAAEDTRNTGRLLDSLGIKASLMAHHDHNQLESAQGIVACLQAGQSVALVCDAGTPAISDPGCELVRAVSEAGFTVVPVPGVSSVLALVCVSGLVKGPFGFKGFLPAKGEIRQQNLVRLLSQTEPQVLFESPHRIIELFELLNKHEPTRQVCAGREMTKQFETFYRGSVNDVLVKIQQDLYATKGEWAVVIAGKAEVKKDSETVLNLNHEVNLEKAATVMLRTDNPKMVVQKLVEMTGLPKKQIYSMVLKVKDSI